MTQINESESEKIRKQSKEIIESFAKVLDRVKVKKKTGKKELGGFRKEGEGDKTDSTFRKTMFENASSKEGDNIIAEKKSW